MKPDLSFLSRLRTSLEGLFGVQPGKAEPLKVVSPVSQERIAEDERIAKRHNAIREGWTFDNMTPQENLIPTNYPTPIPQPSVTPTPEPTAAPGIDSAMRFITNQMPASSTQTPQEYFPALSDPNFMAGLVEADKLRQGLSALLILQSFFESTLGRANNGGNYFGTLPGGEGSGQSSSFNSPSAALNFQLGPGVLGGGANPNMNILRETDPLTPSDVRRLYDSYNPNSPYIDTLISAMFPQ